MKSLKEKKLIYKVVAKKDPEAFGQLYDLYIEKVYRFIFFKVSNREEAEDLTSDAFLKTWNYLITLSDQEIKSFSALIYKVARNNIIDFYRQRAKRQECSIEIAIEEAVALEDDNQEKMQKKQEASQILKHLKKLKQEYQELIFLRYIEELSVKEISQILNKRQTNVRVTLHRAMNTLKKILQEINQ